MSAYMQRLAAAANEIIKSGKPVRVNGPWFMCADNSCTAFTDVCIMSHVEEIERVVEFVPFAACTMSCARRWCGR